jgi:protein-tyrosine phosphatase
MIDLHCHVLAGIDDGPQTIEGSIALARAAAAAGTRTIVATPHVSWSYDNDAATIAQLVQETNEALAEAGVDVTILAGAEVAITRAVELDPAELAALTLAGGPWLLVEFPFTSVSDGLDSLAIELTERGHRLVLAHPERSPSFQRDPALLESLVRAGALASITAGSLTGTFGGTAKRFARELVEAELVHNVASDAHDAVQRPPAIAEPLRACCLQALTEWLTQSVPAAIIGGDASLPTRPQVELEPWRPARDSWWRRGPLRRAS